MGARRRRFIEAVLLRTHNICFGNEIEELMIGHLLPLPGGLHYELKHCRRAPGFSDVIVPSVIYIEIKPRGTFLNYAHGTANSVDPDRAVHRDLSDPGLRCSL